jgi:hypothetical protein
MPRLTDPMVKMLSHSAGTVKPVVPWSRRPVRVNW